MNYIKTKPLVVSLMFLVIHEVLHYFPDLVFWGSFVLLVVVVSGVLWVMESNWEEGILRRSMLPVLLAMGVLSFSFFMPIALFSQIVIVMGTLCFYFLLLYVDQFPYKSFLVTRLNFSFIALVAAYLLFFSISNFSVSLSMPLWILMVIVVFLSFSIFYSILWASGLERSAVILYTVLLGLLVSEIFLVISFWPVDPSAKSMVLVVAMYIFWGLFSNWIERVLTLRVLMEYLLIGMVLMALVLLTASWLPPFLM
ncbi:hypothetical protein KJ855_01665 [Patescibacteria group bacterium]|nr:hypothetical protein [Patescibacteria group bacterium]